MLANIFFLEIDKMLAKFIQKNKCARVARKTLKRYRYGGQGVGRTGDWPAQVLTSYTDTLVKSVVLGPEETERPMK